MSNGTERTEKMIELLRHWQKLERDAVNTCAEIMEDTDNPLADDYTATFVGNVKNNGTETMTAIQVAVTVYNADGEVVTVGQTWLDGDLAPNETMPFEFEVQASEAADSFELYVQGSVKTD